MSTTSPARRAATAAAWVAAGALGATAVTGLAFASDRGATSPGVRASGSGASAPAVVGDAAGRRGAGLRDVLHGELTVKAGDGTKVVDVQRGRITTVSATSLTVVSTDGFSTTYAITSSTVVRKARQTVPASTLAVGQEVVVRGSAGNATVVRTR